jgi:hypothetical protein
MTFKHDVTTTKEQGALLGPLIGTMIRIADRGRSLGHLCPPGCGMTEDHVLQVNFTFCGA